MTLLAERWSASPNHGSLRVGDTLTEAEMLNVVGGSSAAWTSLTP
jgi:hypothetical protein